MKKYLRGISAIIFFLSIASAGFAEETIRLASGEGWPPFMSEELRHFGIIPRIVTEAFSLEGVKVQYVWVPWQRAYIKTSFGEYDGAPGWKKNPEREKLFYFSDPIIGERLVFFHLKSFKFDWNGIDDLKGIDMGIGFESGYSYGTELDNAIKSGKLMVQYASNDKLNFRKLLKGRFQIFPAELQAGFHLIRKLFKPEEVKLITYHPKIINEGMIHVIFPKKNTKSKFFLKIFNRGLMRLRKSGKYDQFLEESRRGDYVIKK